LRETFGVVYVQVFNKILIYQKFEKLFLKEFFKIFIKTLKKFEKFQKPKNE
jgi:hypothetical protein